MLPFSKIIIIITYRIFFPFCLDLIKEKWRIFEWLCLWVKEGGSFGLAPPLLVTELEEV